MRFNAKIAESAGAVAENAEIAKGYAEYAEDTISKLYGFNILKGKEYKKDN